MNVKLIDSIVQMVQALSLEEQQLLVKQLNTLVSAETHLENAPQSERKSDQDPWKVFLSIGEESQLGQLQDASIHHDRYLYQQPQQDS